MSNLIWKTERRKVADLVPYEHNPRTLSREQAQRLQDSLEKFNLVEIPAVNTDGVIIAGHQRLATMKALGRGNEIVDVRVPNRKLTEAELKEYNLRSNKNVGEWDLEILAAHFPEDMLKDVGFDMADLPETAPGNIGGQDKVPSLRKTNIKVGDAFTLGDHILVCGDSTDLNVVKKLGPSEMAFTDPPWNVAIGLDSNPRHRQRNGLINDNLGKDFPAFLQKVGAALAAAVKKDIYVVMGCAEWPNVHAALVAAGFHWSSTIVWVKDIFVLGRSNYHSRYEPIWYGWQKNSSYRADRKQDDVWEFDRPTKSPEHPTMKPVELVEHAILNSSIKGDTVLDLFGGSGTTLLACEKTGRKCRMIELEPGYCQVIVDRWEAFTGRKAKPLRLDK